MVQQKQGEQWAKKIIDETGGEHVLASGNKININRTNPGSFNGFLLKGTSTRPIKKRAGIVPPAPAQVYHVKRQGFFPTLQG